MPKKTRHPSASSHTKDVNLGPLKNYIGFQLRRAQEVSFRAFARRVGEGDISPGRFAILALINDNPGMNQAELSRSDGRDKSTLALALKDLEKRGLVMRKRSRTDGRAYHLELTSLGRKHLEVLTEHAQAHDRRLDQIVGAIHKPLLIHLLERIVSSLEQG
jgi:DNA-binding MarR family transcriptional regulator